MQSTYKYINSSATSSSPDERNRAVASLQVFLLERRVVPHRRAFLTSGESATLELTPNPARTDIDPNKVTKSCTAP